MTKLSQKVELIANVLIIVVALLLVGTFVQRYFFAKTEPTQQARIKPTVGKKVDLPNVDWSAQSKTVVLALQTTCHFCNESTPFYKRLVESAKNKNIKFVAVFPQSVEESTKHLNQLGVTGMEVKQASISALDVSGTPTLILINEKGEVTDYWAGQLSAEKETEVINRIIS